MQKQKDIFATRKRENIISSSFYSGNESGKAGELLKNMINLNLKKLGKSLRAMCFHGICNQKKKKEKKLAAEVLKARVNGFLKKQVGSTPAAAFLDARAS